MAVIARASVVEYFRDQLAGALARQRVPVDDGTAYYVVRLLAESVRHDTTSRAATLLDSRPLAIRLADAMDERCQAPGRALRDVADAALLLGGYFACRASRSVPPTYYHRVGGFAYGTLGQASPVLAPIFATLSAHFAQYADALDEVGQRAEMRTSSGLLRALEQWQSSHDRVTERLLVERGVVLTRGRAVRLQ